MRRDAVARLLVQVGEAVREQRRVGAPVLHAVPLAFGVPVKVSSSLLFVAVVGGCRRRRRR